MLLLLGHLRWDAQGLNGLAAGLQGSPDYLEAMPPAAVPLPRGEVSFHSRLALGLVKRENSSDATWLRWNGQHGRIGSVGDSAATSRHWAIFRNDWPYSTDSIL